MIMVGHSRGNGQNLARHLLSNENEHVTVHDISGFACDDLQGAFKEAEAFSRGTRCQKYLYSLSLNPPAGEEVSTEEFEVAVDRAAETLGLSGQPRVIVFHEKDNRRHCHVVWSRIDTDKMKAIQLDFPKRKLNQLSKDIFLEKDWDLPKGYLEPALRDPKNFTLQEWQQCKRLGQDPREVKAIFQFCWKQSDSRKAFEAALQSYGYRIARGDRRGYVATDINGEVYSLSRYANVKTRELKQRLGDRNDLPSLSEAYAALANDIAPNLKKLAVQQTEKMKEMTVSHWRIRDKLVKLHEKQRSQQKTLQTKRTIAESKVRQDRFNKGLHGLFDRITGAYSKIKRQNELEAYQCARRDQKQRDALIFKQMEQKRALTRQQSRQMRNPQQVRTNLIKDIENITLMKYCGLSR